MYKPTDPVVIEWEFWVLYDVFVTDSVSRVSWLFGHVEKRFDNKAMVNFKIYEVIDWTKIITIYILHNISRSNGNQTLKLGQLIEYPMSNIFIEKSYSKCGREARTRPF